MAYNQVQVNPPNTVSVADGTQAFQLGGKQGEGIVSQLHGMWFTQAYRGNVFHATATGLTVPAIANNLVSVFSLFNPANSNRNLELIAADMGIILATTAVDFLGLYFQRIAGAVTIPTSQTVGTPVSGRLGDTASPQGLFLTAATHVGTPTLAKILSTFGAVTTTGDQPITYAFNGSVILPPNTIASFAMSTAAGTASGLALGLSWVESPL